MKTQKPKSPQEIAKRELRNCLNKIAAEKTGDIHVNGVQHFLEHYIKQAYARPDMAAALMKKLLPDLKATEISGDALVDQSVNYKIEVVKLDGSKDSATFTRKPVTGEYRPD